MRGRLAGASGHVDDGLCEEGVGAAEGVCVAGVSEVFWMCRWTKRLSCVSWFHVWFSLWTVLKSWFFGVEVGAEGFSRHDFLSYWRSFKYSLALLRSLKKSEASVAASPVVAGSFLSG